MFSVDERLMPYLRNLLIFCTWFGLLGAAMALGGGGYLLLHWHSTEHGFLLVPIIGTAFLGADLLALKVIIPWLRRASWVLRHARPVRMSATITYEWESSGTSTERSSSLKGKATLQPLPGATDGFPSLALTLLDSSAQQRKAKITGVPVEVYFDTNLRGPIVIDTPQGMFCSEQGGSERPPIPELQWTDAVAETTTIDTGLAALEQEAHRNLLRLRCCYGLSLAIAIFVLIWHKIWLVGDDPFMYLMGFMDRNGLLVLFIALAITVFARSRFRTKALLILPALRLMRATMPQTCQLQVAKEQDRCLATISAAHGQAERQLEVISSFEMEQMPLWQNATVHCYQDQRTPSVILLQRDDQYLVGRLRG